jgi:hypothetical protein
MTHKLVGTCVLAGLLAGCSSVAVIKNPGPGDTGIRFYRPKPYLLVTPADATGRMVKLKIEYLPDYSEEYSVHPQGKKPPQVQLKDGWNLVAVGGAAPPEKPDEPPPPAAPVDPMKVPEFVVVATNVPIGLYESVFDVAAGRKYLKGWRYVGFSPLGGAGPIGSAGPMGGDPSCGRGPNGQGMTGPDGFGPNGPIPATSSISGPLYGLVFFNGVMTFRQLDEIANNMTCPQYLKPIPEPVKALVVPPQTITTPEVKPEAGGTQTRPETPRPPAAAPGSTAPGLPATNPSASATGGGEPQSSSSPQDRKVERTSTKSNIPAPRIWDLTK